MTINFEYGSVYSEERKPLRLMVYHSYVTDTDVGGLLDQRYVNKFVDGVTGENSKFVKGKPEYEDYQPLFKVTLGVTNTKKQFGGTSQYVVDYELLDPRCPMEVRRYGMELYQYLKSKKREAEREIATKKAERRKARDEKRG